MPTSPRSRADSIVSSDPNAPAWYQSILTEEDFKFIYPGHSSFIDQLRDLAERKATVLADPDLSDEDKQTRVDNLCIKATGGAECALDDLWYISSSKTCSPYG